MFRAVCTIEDFAGYLARSVGGQQVQMLEPELMISQEVTIPFSNGQSSCWRILCYPNGVENDSDGNIDLALFPTSKISQELLNNARVAMRIGLTDLNGCLVVLNQNFCIEGKSKGIWAGVSYEKLQAAADRLLPGGKLTVCAEIAFPPEVWVVSEEPARMPRPTADISQVMLNNFVDIGPSSVLLVFEDGEQRCHTFPLASRLDALSNFFYARWEGPSNPRCVYIAARSRLFSGITIEEGYN